jgi:hypothetical protein
MVEQPVNHRLPPVQSSRAPHRRTRPIYLNRPIWTSDSKFDLLPSLEQGELGRARVNEQGASPYNSGNNCSGGDFPLRGGCNMAGGKLTRCGALGLTEVPPSSPAALVQVPWFVDSRLRARCLAPFRTNVWRNVTSRTGVNDKRAPATDGRRSVSCPVIDR